MSDRMNDGENSGAVLQGDQHNAQPLKIAIIGAGIGGLSTAIGLRRAGHDVELYEQSRLAGEIGAAVHLAPNSNGILRRWGLFAEDFAANAVNQLKDFRYTGEFIREMDLSFVRTMSPHPWHLVHRASLHAALKSAATGALAQAAGPPVQLHTSSRAVSVDADSGTVEFENGKFVHADMVIGADGVYSNCRHAVVPNSPKPFGSGKAAFRFLIPTQLAKDDEETAHLATDGLMCVWFGDDRRVVLYPCNRNQTLNFVCIHPDSESQATAGDEWNKTASLDHILHVFRQFDPALLRLIRKADPEEVKVWQLLDMEKMPKWTKGKLALIGDAAHPFTPHQGQGAGQAIEDSAALAVVLPLGTRPEQVPERLRLYESIRADRAHAIQEASRQVGKDWINGKPQVDAMKYANFNLGYDEHEHATAIFNRWLSGEGDSVPAHGEPVDDQTAP